MHSILPSISFQETRRLVTTEDLLALANFSDEKAHGVSFYFSPASGQDKSHREQLLAVKKLVSNVFGKLETDGISKDLAAIVTTAEEAPHTPSWLKVVFACHDQHIWQSFDLPSFGAISCLEIGRHFHLPPLLQAIESNKPYCVVIVERGKARGFRVQGPMIEEVPGRFKTEVIQATVDDSRVGWSHHIEDNRQEHAHAYLKDLALEIHRFMEEKECPRLVIGCREDLWSELEVQLLQPELASLIGRFHLPNFDVSPYAVLQAVRPIVEEHRQRHYQDLLHKIHENISQGAIGIEQVLPALEEGRVQTLLLGDLPGEMITERRQCNHLSFGAGKQCVFCRSNNTHAVSAEEALIHKGLLTNAEVLVPAPGGSYGIDKVAAWLRY